MYESMRAVFDDGEVDDGGDGDGGDRDDVFLAMLVFCQVSGHVS